ncbi:MAG: hypothetical protein ABW000_25915 [Actinoplanes sp.]
MGVIAGRALTDDLAECMPCGGSGCMARGAPVCGRAEGDGAVTRELPRDGNGGIPGDGSGGGNGGIVRCAPGDGSGGGSGGIVRGAPGDGSGGGGSGGGSGGIAWGAPAVGMGIIPRPG